MSSPDAEFINRLMLIDTERTVEDNNLITSFVQQKGPVYVERIARKTKVIAFAAHTLSQLFPKDEKWKEIHEKFCSRNILYLKMLKNIFVDTHDAGIKTLCVTENFGVILRGKACIGCFQSSDIDLTADRIEEKQIEFLLRKHGFIRESDHGQVTKYKNSEIVKEGFSLQIAWVAVARSYLNQDAPTKRLAIARKKATYLDDSYIKVLSIIVLLF